MPQISSYFFEYLPFSQLIFYSACFLDVRRTRRSDEFSDSLRNFPLRTGHKEDAVGVMYLVPRSCSGP